MLLLQSVLLLLLHCQPLLLHVLLHWRADRAAVALALLVVLQQLPGRHTPVSVKAWGSTRERESHDTRCCTAQYRCLSHASMVWDQSGVTRPPAGDALLICTTCFWRAAFSARGLTLGMRTAGWHTPGYVARGPWPRCRTGHTGTPPVGHCTWRSAAGTGASAAAWRCTPCCGRSAWTGTPPPCPAHLRLLCHPQSQL